MEAAECSGRSRKRNMSAEEKGKPNMSAPLSGSRETKRLRRGGKIGEDKHPMADSELEPERSKLSRKRRTTPAERKAKLEQKILKKAGPKYWALVDLVKQRDKCYEGPGKSRAYRTGALLWKEARALLLYGKAREAESHCEFALEVIASRPLSESEHVVNHPEFIKRRPTRAERKAKLKQKILKKAGPKYRALGDLVKQRDKCYEGPEKSESDHVMIHPEFIKEYRIQTENCANTALEVYNQQNPGDEFELVEAISSSGIIHYGCWYHVNFTAKPKNTEASGGGDSSLKLFFAELNRQIRPEVSPNSFICRCSIVDLDNKSKVLSGCGYCHRSDKIYHPVGQFKCGLFPYRAQLTLLTTHIPPQTAQLGAQLAAWLRLNQTK